MATNTPNFGLKKPAQTDFYDVDDFNGNMDVIDTELKKRGEKPASFTEGNFPKFDVNGNLVDSGKNPASIPSAVDVANKVDKIAGKGLSTQDYTTTEKAKLAALQNYNDTEVRGLIEENQTKIDTHAPKSVIGEIGVHDIRYFSDKLQVKNSGGTWEDAGGGGAKIPVGDCTAISITVGNGQLTLKWKDPDDLVISGAVVAEWAMTKLVRKVGGYPTSETDGTLVLTNSVRNQYQNNAYVDSPLTNGTTYYYKLFPVTKANAVNTGNANNVSATPQAYKTFGVSIDLTNSNPLTAVTYTDDATGMTAGSAAWDSQPIFKDIKPCVLNNGVVQYYLNPSNFNQKTDGSSSDITSGSAGDVMIEFPKTGFQISTNGNIVSVKITDDPAKAGFRYYAHTRDTEGDKNKLYIGAYKGYVDGSNKLRSLSGKVPYVNQTIGTFRTRAQANGAGYDQFAFFPMTLIQCLFLVRFKSLDSQTALGQGYTGGSAAVNTGATNANGMFYGTTSATQQVKCFGLEDLWGNVFDWIDGLYSNASWNILTAFKNFSDTGSGYTDRGQGATANVGGWLSVPQGTTEKGFIAKTCAGSSTTFFADDANLGAGYLPVFGGNWADGASAGVFRLGVNGSASYVNAGIGGRLMFL